MKHKRNAISGLLVLSMMLLYQVPCFAQELVGQGYSQGTSVGEPKKMAAKQAAESLNSQIKEFRNSLPRGTSVTIKKEKMTFDIKQIQTPAGPVFIVTATQKATVTVNGPNNGQGLGQ